MHRTLKILVMVSLLPLWTVWAQQPGAKPPKDYSVLGTASEHYGIFGIQKIPLSCRHSRELFGQKVCRVYVKFGRPMTGRKVFYAEDWTNKPDSIQHVRLLYPDDRGVYLDGIPGHKIWWQVNVK